MEQVLSAIISEDSAPARLQKKLSLAMRRTQYDRLRTDADGQSSLSVEVPKSFNLGRTSRQSDIEAPGHEEVPKTPSLLGKVKEAYEDLMVKTAENASNVSVVPVARKLERSLTLGSGFGSKVEVLPTETNLGFKLTKAEEKYLEYLRRRYDGRYA